MSKIIYENEDKTISILIPVQEVLNTLSIEEIAEKDVPQDLPYWIVDDDDIPTDRTNRDAWVLDGSEGNPDGYGGESDEFTDAQLLELYNAGVIK